MVIPECHIVIEDLTLPCQGFDYDLLEKIVRHCDPLKSVSIVFVPISTMRTLNQTYRHKSGATDLLSFVDEPGVGDMVICPAHIWAYARKKRIPFRLRFWHLIAHGLTHLQNLNHYEEEERKTFLQMEREFFRQIGEFLPDLLRWKWDDFYRYEYEERS